MVSNKPELLLGGGVYSVSGNNIAGTATILVNNDVDDCEHEDRADQHGSHHLLKGIHVNEAVSLPTMRVGNESTGLFGSNVVFADMSV